MKSLLAAHGFARVSDENIPALARALPSAASRAARKLKQMRIVVAEHRPPAVG
jgi:hypothetical protein